jgi:hypothetical protein
MIILEYNSNSEEIFNGNITKKNEYKNKCRKCNSKIKIKITEIYRSAWFWFDNIEAEEKISICKEFNIDSEDKDIEKGMSSVVKCKCHKCKTEYYFCFNIHEYANSHFRIKYLGIIERN